MAKRACFTLPAVAATLFCMTGCAQNGGFTLALNSKAFSMSISAQSAPSLDTYHREGEGDVPYVKLSQYAEALGDSMSHNPYSVQKEGSTFTVHYAESEREGAPKHALFRFDASDSSLTYLGGAKYQSRYYATVDPFADGNDKVFVPNKEKTTVKRLWETRTIDLTRYGFRLYGQGGELLAPFGLFQAAFTERASPEWPKPMVFNGRDYYLLNNSTGLKASCLSSKLNFRYVDQALQNLAGEVTDATVEPTLDFHPATPSKGEKYRLESNVVTMPEFTPPSGGEKAKHIPDLFVRMVLNEEGKGSYSFVESATGKPLELDAFGIKTRSMQFREDEDALSVALMPAVEGAPGDMIRIHKGETFFGRKTRSKEYATYDYNLIRLHFGEYYGLHDRKLPFDAEIAPYKERLTSTSYDEYNDGLTEFLLRTVDDGHTSIEEYSLFGSKTFGPEERGKSNEYLGYRKKGLYDIKDALEAYRAAAKIQPGLQVVGDTAYLTFDSFMGSSNAVTDYTLPADQYATGNTPAFAYAALKEVSTKHPEVKRVVYDLTCNGGGDVSALPFLLATMSADPVCTTFNYYAGEVVDAHYKVDLNGDGKFGEAGDTYQGKYDFYILTSALSFSCANAFPGYAKAMKCATIVGERSGGGGSMVDTVYTVSGYCFHSSSILSFATRDGQGNTIENDAGIPVDYRIPPSSFYNREAINASLDKLR